MKNLSYKNSLSRLYFYTYALGWKCISLFINSPKATDIFLTEMCISWISCEISKGLFQFFYFGLQMSKLFSFYTDLGIYAVIFLEEKITWNLIIAKINSLIFLYNYSTLKVSECCILKPRSWRCALSFILCPHIVIFCSMILFKNTGKTLKCCDF